MANDMKKQQIDDDYRIPQKFALFILFSAFFTTASFYVTSAMQLSPWVHSLLSNALLIIGIIRIWATNKGLVKRKVRSIIIGLAAIISFAFYPFRDFSADTISIYRTAQRMINLGWNFIYDPLGNIFENQDASKYSWENPSYVTAASKLPYALRNQFYLIFGENSSIVSNLFLIVVLLVLMLNSNLMKTFKPGFARTILVISIFAPTVVTQFTSYYSDFHIGIFATIIVFCIIEKFYFCPSLKNSKNLDSIILVSLGLLLLSKLSGFIPVIIMLILLFAFNGKFSQQLSFFKNRYIIVPTLSLGILFLQMYLNLQNFQDAFYPVGKSTTSILMGTQTGFIFDYQVIGFLKSIFGFPSIGNFNSLAPNWIQDLDVNYVRGNLSPIDLGAVDIRVSGFGFGYGLVYLAVVAINIRLFLKFPDERSRSLGLLIIFFLVPFIPGSYWARLIVYVYPLVWASIVRKKLIESNKSIQLNDGKKGLRVKSQNYAGSLLTLIAINTVIAFQSSLISDFKSSARFSNFTSEVSRVINSSPNPSVAARNSSIPNDLMMLFPELKLSTCEISNAKVIDFETWVCD